METTEKSNYRLLRTVYDVRRLRCNVARMSFIALSLSWIPVPVIVRDS